MNHSSSRADFTILQKLGIVFLVGLVLFAFWMFVWDTGASTEIGVTLTTNPTLETGLVGHWTFDGPDVDWGSSTAEIKDRSGNNNHGDAQGGMSTRSVTPGPLGQAMGFDGVGDSVSANQTSISKNSPFAASFWMKPVNTDAGVPLSWKIDSNWGVTYGALNNGTGGIAVHDDDTNNAIVSYKYGTYITANEWQHILFTFEDGDITLYRNGEIVEPAGSGVAYNLQHNNVNIGYRRTGLSYFDGALDDVRIYNRALSPAEVKRLYELGEATKVAETITTNLTLDTGLVGHWTFDGLDVDWGSTTAEIKDRSGNGYDGDANNRITINSVTPGVLGQALHFERVEDGLSNDGVVLLPQAISDEYTNVVTLCAWFKPDEDADGGYIAGEGSALYIGYDYTNARVRAKLYNGTTEYFSDSANGSVAPGMWHHVCGVADGSTWVLWVDGVAVADQETYTGVISPSALTWVIGQYGASDSGFEGAIDDVRIYNRALSPAEVKRLYELGEATKVAETITTNLTLDTGLVGHWTFDGPDVDWGSTTAEIKDRSGNGYDGDANNRITINSVTPGVLGQALHFERVEDGLSNDGVVSVPQAISDEYTNIATLCAWFKPDEDADGGYIAGENSAFSISYNYTGARASAKLYNGTTQYFSDSAIGSVAPGMWHHTCGVADGSTWVLWVDGVAVADQETYTGVINPSGLGRWEIGEYGTSDSGFEGAIDDVRIYNRALSPAEVKRLYELGR